MSPSFLFSFASSQKELSSYYKESLPAFYIRTSEKLFKVDYILRH